MLMNSGILDNSTAPRMQFQMSDYKINMRFFTQNKGEKTAKSMVEDARNNTEEYVYIITPKFFEQMDGKESPHNLRNTRAICFV